MISIIVIGKNESFNLKNLYLSLSKLNIKNEIIFIDSNSEDQSIEISKSFCNLIYKMKKTKNLCASSCRHVGTLQAKYDWILYLDGDMILEKEFIEFLNQKKFINLDKKIAGYIGYYQYICKDGSARDNVLLQAKNSFVSYIGGAILIQKKVILEAGNWDPCIFDNEELDLLTKIHRLGYNILAIDEKMVKHFSKKISNFHSLLGNFYPLNKRFYGFGQLIASQYQNKSLPFFIRKYPYPFILFFIIIMGIYNYKFLILLFFFQLYISVKKRFYYSVMYFTDIYRAILGIFHYKKYKPLYKLIYKKENI